MLFCYVFCKNLWSLFKFLYIHSSPQKPHKTKIIHGKLSRALKLDIRKKDHKVGTLMVFSLIFFVYPLTISEGIIKKIKIFCYFLKNFAEKSRINI